MLNCEIHSSSSPDGIYTLELLHRNSVNSSATFQFLCAHHTNIFGGTAAIIDVSPLSLSLTISGHLLELLNN